MISRKKEPESHEAPSQRFHAEAERPIPGREQGPTEADERIDAFYLGRQLYLKSLDGPKEISSVIERSSI